MFGKFRNRYFLILDLVLLSLTPTISLALRLSLPWGDKYTLGLLYFTLYSIPVKIITFYILGFYKRLWQYASVDAIVSILWGVGIASLIDAGGYFAFLSTGWLKVVGLPRSIPIIDSMLTLIVIGGTRLSLRMLQYQSRASSHDRDQENRVLIVGAGDAGQMVAREMHTSKHVKSYLVGFVDDDPIKIGSILHNVPVLGAITEIPEVVKKHRIDEIIIAMPTAPGDVIRKVVNLSEDSGITPRTLPGIFELISGDVTVNQLREVQVGDLLRRQPVQIGLSRVVDLLKGKRVLVTGAGGSIGSELCNQISHCDPETLYALGHGENSLFVLPSKLRYWSKDQRKEKLEVIIADIRDKERMRHVFERIQPDIVFHAAAHKHVPLMEDNLEDAVTNNVLGTKILLDQCKEVNVERFVYISTDKAVEPVNVMGMTKRIGEILVGLAARETGKPYVSVRFGNVLGSRGSVVPFFQKQIEEGGPVTITDPEVKRFFMTIPEAVQLVLQASALGHQDDIFVLDMGEQIKIQELAVELIQLSGLELGQDIELVYTGLRPGEKLSEELFNSWEQPLETAHEKLRVVKVDIPISTDLFNEQVDQLISYAQTGDVSRGHDLLEKLTGPSR